MKNFQIKTNKFVSKLFSKWRSSNRTLPVFLKREATWLAQEHFYPQTEHANKRQTEATPTRVRGRPKKLFSTSAKRSQLAKVVCLSNNNSPEQLTRAAQRSYRLVGKRMVADVIEKATKSSPRTLKKMKAVSSHESKGYKSYAPEEALAMIIDLDIRKQQYISLRKGALDRGVNLYPSYDSVLAKKKECYPAASSMVVTETLCEIKLQSLLDITVKRLIIVLEDALQNYLVDEAPLEFIWKWGCDGSGGHSRYKQKFLGDNSNATDSDILMTSIVPIQLYQKTEQKRKILWTNPRSSSTRFCRPIRFAFTKENSATTIAEFERIEREISNLQPSMFNLNGRNHYIQHILLKTMVDGKVCNAVMKNAATQKCYICGASPVYMNKLDKVVENLVSKDSFSFGLSTLHAHIRFFECLIHISYRLEIKTWQVRGTENKAKFKDRKTYIQNALRSGMGLLVDIPKQGGGNTNDGNTARTFFKNPEKASEITGIDVEIIRRFANILTALSSGLPLNKEAFREYCMATAKLYVNLYAWFYMPTSVHKILIHGADIADSFLIPIGQLSEDVQEARQKDWKRFRQDHSRKSARIKTNTDILNNLLISSDPVITNFRELPWKRSKPLSKEVVSLLNINEIIN